MVRWQAIGPISVRLGEPSLSHDNIFVSTYDHEKLDRLLNKQDQEYWPPAHMSASYRGECWIKLDYVVEDHEDYWEKAVSTIMIFLQALGLFKSTFRLLAVGGILVSKAGRGSMNFGWENTILGKPYYYLRREEQATFIDLLTKYEKFLKDNKASPSNKQLNRIYSAIQFYTRVLQSLSPVERHIYLSIALESLYGEVQQELKYRFSNRAALLLGDDLKRRKEVYSEVREAYDKRSKILHGATSWRVNGVEVLRFNEIIRQSLLRCMSLYSHGYSDIGKVLDDCMHDPEKHSEMLEDARELFWPHCENKKLELR